MKKLTILSVVVFGVVMLVSASFAQDMATENAVVENQPVEVGNKICPVSGHKVGEMGKVVTIEHNGKIYNLCCAMCAGDFKKDADKFSKIADDEVAGAETGE